MCPIFINAYELTPPREYQIKYFLSDQPTHELDKLRSELPGFVSLYWAKDEFPNRIIIYDFKGKSVQEAQLIMGNILKRDIEIEEDTIDSFKYPFLTRKLIYESIVKHFKSEKFSDRKLVVLRKKVGSFLLINSLTISETEFYRLIPRLQFDVKFYYDDWGKPIYLLVLDLGVHVDIKVSIQELMEYLIRKNISNNLHKILVDVPIVAYCKDISDCDYNNCPLKKNNLNRKVVGRYIGFHKTTSVKSKETILSCPKQSLPDTIIKITSDRGWEYIDGNIAYLQPNFATLRILYNITRGINNNVENPIICSRIFVGDLSSDSRVQTNASYIRISKIRELKKRLFPNNEIEFICGDKIKISEEEIKVYTERFPE